MGYFKRAEFWHRTLSSQELESPENPGRFKGWTGVLMTEDSSFHWPAKRRHVYSETSRRAGLEFVCVFGHDEFILFENSFGNSAGRSLRPVHERLCCDYWEHWS